MGAKTFQELRAWQFSAELRDRIVALCETPPLRQDLTLRNQLRDSARSAPRLIAEGFGRYGRREFSRYLTMARAELLELQNDLGDAWLRKVTPPELVADLEELLDRALRSVTSLRNSLDR